MSIEQIAYCINQIEQNQSFALEVLKELQAWNWGSILTKEARSSNINQEIQKQLDNLKDYLKRMN